MKFKPAVKGEFWEYPAVNLDRLDWEHMAPVIETVKRAFHTAGYECRCSAGCEVLKTNNATGLRELIHSIRSLHQRGRALDFSFKGIGHLTRIMLQEEIQDRLGKDYDVVLEGDHLHVEYDPK